MHAEDRAYYLRRAEAELSLAQVAAHPSAVRSHYVLAGHYLDKAYGPAPGALRRPRKSRRGTSAAAAAAFRDWELAAEFFEIDNIHYCTSKTGISGAIMWVAAVMI